MNLELTETDIAADPVSAARQLDELARIAEDNELESESGFALMINRIPKLRRMVLGAAIRALGAERSLYDRGNKEWVTEPDWASRLKAVVWIASYSDGLPTQTTLNVNIGDKPGAEVDLNLEEAVHKSPALRQRLEKLVGPKAAG